MQKLINHEKEMSFLHTVALAHNILQFFLMICYYVTFLLTKIVTPIQNTHNVHTHIQTYITHIHINKKQNKSLPKTPNIPGRYRFWFLFIFSFCLFDFHFVLSKSFFPIYSSLSLLFSHSSPTFSPSHTPSSPQKGENLP